MEWTQSTLYLVVALFAVVLALWLINFYLVSKKGASSPVITRLMYVIAIVATIVCAVRNAYAYEEKTILATNIVVLICIVISWVRIERGTSDPSDESDQSDE